MSRNKYNKRLRSMSSVATTPRGTDSRPGSFAAEAFGTEDQDKWLSYQPVLEWLDVPTAVTCMSETIRGAYARTQWTYELLEQQDGLMSACVKRRRAALSDVPWDVRTMDDIPDELSNLADRQKAVLQDFYNGLAGFKQSLLALGQAEFRGFKILQKTLNSRGDLTLEALDNWNWVRDGYRGKWGWNPRGAFGLTSGDAIPVDPTNLIIRPCSLPIDHVGMFNVLSRKTTMGQWRVYNGTYGVPVIMLYMPEGISPEDRQKFIETARRITSSGKGVLPAGSKADILACSANSFDSFDRILTREDRDLILATTGGQLTMLAEAGSGTLAGGAHQTAFDQLAAMEGEEIADLLNEQLTADILDEYFPGEPHLVQFVMEQLDEDGGRAAITDIATLASAGYRVSPDTVQEQTGYEVTEGVNPSLSYNTGEGGMGAMPTQQLNSAPRNQVSIHTDQSPVAESAPLNSAEAGSGALTDEEAKLLTAIINPPTAADISQSPTTGILTRLMEASIKSTANKDQ